jgi:hypothetical protein
MVRFSLLLLIRLLFVTLSHSLGDILVNFGGFTSRGPTRDCSVLDYNLALRNLKGVEWHKLTEEDAMPDNPSDFTATRIDHCRCVSFSCFYFLSLL